MNMRGLSSPKSDCYITVDYPNERGFDGEAYLSTRYRGAKIYMLSAAVGDKISVYEVAASPRSYHFCYKKVG